MDINRNKFIKNSWIYFIFIFLLIAMVGYFFMNRVNKKPIIIGFDVQLTGKQSELGIQERNGVQLAVEKINAEGGISGRKIQLLVRDDFGLPDQAQKMDGELIKDGSVAIIGHATSAQTIEGLKVTNPAKVVMIGATISTPKLSGLDDYFFRVYPSFKDSSKSFAEYIYKKNNIKQITIIYDLDNAAYSKDYVTTFQDRFKSLGGNIKGEIAFSSKQQPDFSPLLAKLHDSKTEGMLIVGSDIDTALIAQKIRLMDWQIPLFTSAWAQTQTLINNGGAAVQGMKLEQSYALSSKSQAFAEFQSKYKSRFGNEPSFGAAFGYEGALVLTDALKKTGGKSEGLKEELLKTHNFKGLMDNLSFDKFGDVQRPFYLSAINEGKFVILDKLTLTSGGGE